MILVGAHALDIRTTDEEQFFLPKVANIIRWASLQPLSGRCKLT
jgi:hypothetical protein